MKILHIAIAVCFMACSVNKQNLSSDIMDRYTHELIFASAYGEEDMSTCDDTVSVVINEKKAFAGTKQKFANWLHTEFGKIRIISIGEDVILHRDSTGKDYDINVELSSNHKVKKTILISKN